ncbi:MAG: hypothetical protein II882_08275 [Lachnospiraceae bacterium]|nr:hypothetical protein [Lachnospiraceae bacterium]
MSFFDKLENRFGRYAVRNLMMILIVLYVAGFILNLLNPTFYFEYLSLNMAMIFKGQIWRLFTFVIYPPSTNILWFLLECFIFYMLGRNLERLWGSFYFDLYIFIGLLSLVLAALIVYLATGYSLALTPDSLYMSLILAFGISVPDATFYIYMILPVKAKYLMIFYGALLVFQFVTGNWVTRVSLIASVANFLIFFLIIRRPVMRVRQKIKYAQFRSKVQAGADARVHQTGGSRHRCVICGRTELTDPDLEFRYCSKCTGGKEYCLDHLYTHVHQ